MFHTQADLLEYDLNVARIAYPLLLKEGILIYSHKTNGQEIVYENIGISTAHSAQAALRGCVLI